MTELFHCYSLTINNPIHTDVNLAQNQNLSVELEYAITGFQGDKNKNQTFHMQCLVVFKRPVAFTTVKNCYRRAHIQKIHEIGIQAGFTPTFTNAVDYCKKEGRWFEYGDYHQAQQIYLKENENENEKKKEKEKENEKGLLFINKLTKTKILRASSFLTK